MENPIFVHLPMDNSRYLTWTGSKTNFCCRKDPLDVVAKAAVGMRVVAVVGGLESWITQVPAPKTSHSNMEKAVPFLLEEQLSSPVETLHFALGRRRVDGNLPVVVLARSVLDRCLKEMQGAGMQPERLVCEPLLLPWKPGSWTLVLTHEKIIVRTGLESGFALDPENMEQALTWALSGEGKTGVTQLHVLDFSRGRVGMDFSVLGIPVHTEKKEGDPLSLVAKTFKDGPCLNLLQGMYAPRDGWRDGWRFFRLTALLLAVWLLFRGGYALMEQHRLAQHTQEVEKRMEAIFRDSFPNVKRVVDPQAQMHQQWQALRLVDRSRPESAFLTLMAHAGVVLKTVSGVTLKRVRFQDGKLDLFLRLKDLQQLDQIRQAMEKDSSFSVVIQNANRGKEGVEGNLRIFKK